MRFGSCPLPIFANVFDVRIIDRCLGDNRFDVPRQVNLRLQFLFCFGNQRFQPQLSFFLLAFPALQR